MSGSQNGKGFGGDEGIRTLDLLSAIQAKERIARPAFIVSGSFKWYFAGAGLMNRQFVLESQNLECLLNHC